MKKPTNEELYKAVAELEEKFRAVGMQVVVVELTALLNWARTAGPPPFTIGLPRPSAAGQPPR